ncbi:MAG: hypothetical protein F7O42_02405 [Opitutae bacterium]|nr:hypothetical protein [Opitutae bacterium]
MRRKFILSLVALLTVTGSGALYFTLRNQMRDIENNLILSRSALQEKILEAVELESRIVTAREETALQQRLAEEEAAKASDFKQRVESLSEKIAQAGSAKASQSEEIRKLGESNRLLNLQINTLRASASPPDWQERQARLQSRVLELEAENTTLKKSPPKVSLSGIEPSRALPSDPAAILQTRFAQPVGEIIRVGPGGSFVVLDYGRAKGAGQGQSLVLTRNQRAVGLVHLTHITEDFSIAQILTSTNTGDNLNVPDIHAGDMAHIH